jgi:hypothetical protein
MRCGHELRAGGALVQGVLGFLMLTGGLTGWRAAGEAHPPSLSPDAGVSEAAAKTLADKLVLLSNKAANSAAPLKPITITELEANSYLRLRGHEFLPPAVKNPEIRLAPNLVTAAGDVDFGELGEFGSKNDDWGAKFLALVFKGRQRVVATGKLETGNGEGKLTIQSLSVGSTSIPPVLVNFLVEDYVERRYHIDLSKPFALPEHVTHIGLGHGQATLFRLPRATR